MQKQTPAINLKEYQAIAFQVLELLRRDKSTDLIEKIGKYKSDTDLKIERIHADLIEKIANTKTVLLQWVLGLITGYTLLLVALFKFFE